MASMKGRSPAGEDYGMERLQRSLGAGSRLPDVLNQAWTHLEKLCGRDRPTRRCLSCCDCDQARQQSYGSIPRSGPVQTGARLRRRMGPRRGLPRLWIGARSFSRADEAVTNIIRHTYHGAPEHPIVLSASEITGKEFHLHLRDYGPPVDKALAERAVISKTSSREGLGLNLIEHGLHAWWSTFPFARWQYVWHLT